MEGFHCTRLSAKLSHAECIRRHRASNRGERGDSLKGAYIVAACRRCTLGELHVKGKRDPNTELVQLVAKPDPKPFKRPKHTPREALALGLPRDVVETWK